MARAAAAHRSPVELERFDESYDDDFGAPTEVTEPPGSPTPGRAKGRALWLVASLLAACGPVLVAGAIVVSAVVAADHRDVERASPSGSASSVPLPTGSRSIAGTGPVLGSTVGGDLLAVVPRDGYSELVRIDLDTGDTTVEAVPLAGKEAIRLLGRNGTIVLTDATSAVMVRPDLTTHQLTLSQNDIVAAYPAPDTGQVWAWGWTSRDLVLFDLESGEMTRRFELPDGTDVVGADPDGRPLLHSANGGTFRYDPETRKAEQVSTGRLVALGRRVVVEEVCDEGLLCGVYTRDLRTGVKTWATSGIGPPLDPTRAWPAPAALSPDERWLAAWSEGGLLMVIDTTTGSIVRTWRRPDARAATWTPDGQWLLVLTTSGIEAEPWSQGWPGRVITLPGIDLSHVAGFTVLGHA